MSNVPKNMVSIPSGRVWTDMTEQELKIREETAVPWKCSDWCPDSGGATIVPPRAWKQVSGFWADKYEYANKDLERVLKICKEKKLDCGVLNDIPPAKADFDAPDQPLNRVNYGQAKFLCEFDGKRLPADAEWFRMGRGKSGKDLYAVKGGQSLKKDGKKLANFDNAVTTPIGTYPPSSWGIYDLTGNVPEFVADRYVYIDIAKNDDEPEYIIKVSEPGDPPDTEQPMVATRGGHHNDKNHTLLVGNWGAFDQPPETLAGFRCVRSSSKADVE